MQIYKFVGGPNHGTVGVADREPFGTPTVRGQQLVDERGLVVGRVVDERDAPLAVLRRAPAPAKPVPAPKAPEPEPEPEQVVFEDEQTWRRHVKAWGVERGLVRKSQRGRAAQSVLDAWIAEHGAPVYGD